MNEVDPPYTIRIVGTENLSKDLRDELELTKRELENACADFRNQEGHDVEIRFETYP